MLATLWYIAISLLFDRLPSCINNSRLLSITKYIIISPIIAATFYTFKFICLKSQFPELNIQIFNFKIYNSYDINQVQPTLVSILYFLLSLILNDKLNYIVGLIVFIKVWYLRSSNQKWIDKVFFSQVTWNIIYNLNPEEYSAYTCMRNIVLLQINSVCYFYFHPNDISLRQGSNMLKGIFWFIILWAVQSTPSVIMMVLWESDPVDRKHYVNQIEIKIFNFALIVALVVYIRNSHKFCVYMLSKIRGKGKNINEIFLSIAFVSWGGFKLISLSLIISGFILLGSYYDYASLVFKQYSIAFQFMPLSFFLRYPKLIYNENYNRIFWPVDYSLMILSVYSLRSVFNLMF